MVEEASLLGVYPPQALGRWDTEAKAASFMASSFPLPWQGWLSRQVGKFRPALIQCGGMFRLSLPLPAPASPSSPGTAGLVPMPAKLLQPRLAGAHAQLLVALCPSSLPHDLMAQAALGSEAAVNWTTW